MSSSVAGTTISAITEATDRGGTVPGRGGRGGRGRVANAARGRGPHRPPRTMFKGDTEGMNANVFQCYEEQSDRRQFIKTKDALNAYVKKNLKYNEDLASLFAEEMTLPELDMPEELPEGSTLMETRLWEGELQEFVKRHKCFREKLNSVPTGNTRPGIRVVFGCYRRFGPSPSNSMKRGMRTSLSWKR